MAYREVRLLLGALELYQRRADVLLGCSSAVLLLVAHLVKDRARGSDASGKSIGRARHGIDDLVAELAARAVLVVVEQRLEILFAGVITGQERGHLDWLRQCLGDFDALVGQRELLVRREIYLGLVARAENVQKTEDDQRRGGNGQRVTRIQGAAARRFGPDIFGIEGDVNAQQQNPGGDQDARHQAEIALNHPGAQAGQQTENTKRGA